MITGALLAFVSLVQLWIIDVSIRDVTENMAEHLMGSEADGALYSTYTLSTGLWASLGICWSLSAVHEWYLVDRTSRGGRLGLYLTAIGSVVTILLCVVVAGPMMALVAGITALAAWFAWRDRMATSAAAAEPSYLAAVGAAFIAVVVVAAAVRFPIDFGLATALIDIAPMGEMDSYDPESGVTQEHADVVWKRYAGLVKLEQRMTQLTATASLLLVPPVLWLVAFARLWRGYEVVGTIPTRRRDRHPPA
jgi:hypothetical protein